ncbi:transcriptional repressor TCF25-domain-containing protein [Scheffersomyces amazonensis]|uniref:transcriptional repressor TCF25-domain-containing protein n=1 Tax=Scheffersomyces amazonensis TaxID=1078765 RepID=UPI00315C5620
MSSRALKRLEKQRLEASASNSPVPEEVEEIDEPIVAKPKFNAFALLNDDDDDDDSEEEPEQEEIEEEEKKPQPVVIEGEKDKEEDFSDEFIEPSPSPQPSTTKKKSKSKKKKNKKKAQNKEKDKQEEEDHDDIDKILAELSVKDKKIHIDEDQEDMFDFEAELDLESDASPIGFYDSNFKYFTSSKLKASLPLLSIKNIKNLDADEEFKTLFGNLSNETIEDANSTTALAISPEVLQQFRKIAKLTRGWGGNDRRNVPGTSRKLLISKIRDDYLPTAQKPMSMEEINELDLNEYLQYKEDSAEDEELQFKIKREFELGVRYFRFSKINTVNERVANTKFYASVVLTPDHESLMQLLQQYPYHAETLLQVAMVLLRQGEHKSTSNALIEKALFVFDRSFQKRFHELLSGGNSELIRLPFEGFLNRQFYICLFRYISALGERSAYFTALSYCKFLLALSPAEDPLGVRYFIDHYAILSEEYKYLISLSSSPLCCTYIQWLTPGIAYSTVLAYLYLNDESKAIEQLKLAYHRFPYTAYKLVELIGLSDPLPIQESDISITVEDKITAETYLVRFPLLWNDPHKKLFLQEQLVKLFINDPIKKSKSKGVAQSIYSLLGFKNSQDDTKDIPFNLIRFVILSGENKLMAKLPEVVWSRDDILEYDILPPQRNTKINYDEHRGIMDIQRPIVDSLIDYVDQNLLGAIVQNHSSTENEFDRLLQQFQQQLEERAPPEIQD